MNDNGYVRAFGINYVGAIPKIKKSQEQLQPVCEAFTNSLEAIKLQSNHSENGAIRVKMCFRNNLLSTEGEQLDFDSIIIEDSGVGFNEDEFERLINLNDTGKGPFNKGSGRVQFLHYFDKTEYSSIFKEKESNNNFKHRKFTLSKNQAFLKNNAIIRHDSLTEIDANMTGTILTFKSPLDEKDRKFYTSLTIAELKEFIIDRYLAFFCENRFSLPDITLQKIVDLAIQEEDSIKSEDIPLVDKEKDIIIYYSKMSFDGKSVEKTDNSEILNLKGFKISKEKLKKNGLKLTSKGEIARELPLDNLSVDDYIDDNRYLFLLSGNYINSRDTDTRGFLSIPKLDEFKKQMGESTHLFSEEEILFDDIRDKANETILEMYDEIVQKASEKATELEELKQMFLLSPESIKEAKIKLNDTEEKILEKVYMADAKLIAKKDAEIKKRIDALISLNPNSKDFEQHFKIEIDELTMAIPLQNRTALTHYVARRKLVLELFEKILNKKLLVQENSKRNEDERLLHNLIFQQKTDNPNNSDLWIMNEDFVYFNGTSESKLGDLSLEGIKVMKEEDKLTDEEKLYRDSLEENKYEKRPDILLFPNEGKCIIIELKNPNKNLSEHLLQINNYASLIRNLSKDEYKFDTFYGYLIGGKLDADQVQDKDSGFVKAYNFDYVFKPYYRVRGKFGRSDGSLYTEAITYHTLLERAKKRNDLFIKKLFNS